MYVGQAFDSCWDFAQQFYSEQFNAQIPADAYACRAFSAVDEPQHGDLVMIDNGAHCGIYTDRGILHQRNPYIGVVKQNARTINADVEYYRLIR